MNIKYHLACGVVMDLALHTNGIMTLFSILPDHPLLKNEWDLFIKEKKFNADEVPMGIWKAYMATHSLFILPLIYLISPMGSYAYLVHIVCDWFTHTGRFSGRPFYPFNYVIPFGKEILK